MLIIPCIRHLEEGSRRPPELETVDYFQNESVVKEAEDTILVNVRLSGELGDVEGRMSHSGL